MSPTLRKIAQGYVDYARQIGTRGRARNQGAFDFFMGASVAYAAIGNEGDARMLKQIVEFVFMNSKRGAYRHVLDIIDEMPEQKT